MYQKPLLTAAMFLAMAATSPGADPAPRAAKELPQSIPAAAGDLVVGPLATETPGRSLDSVILDIEMHHDMVRDLAITLHYDQNRDGEFDVSARVVVVLPEYDEESASTIWACPFVLDGAYRFEFPSPMQAESFRGVPSGGDFYLEVMDYESESRGMLEGWDVEIGYADESLADVPSNCVYAQIMGN